MALLDVGMTDGVGFCAIDVGLASFLIKRMMDGLKRLGALVFDGEI